MQTRTCRDCGKLMVRVATGTVLPSYPPQFPMVWRCGCGRIEEAGTEIDRTDEERFRRIWDLANLAGTGTQ